MTTQQLLERYLHAVEFWLPRKQRRDLLAEISEDLHSQVEERESSLGRSLTAAELEALLKQRGRPLVVANGYRPQQALIGPMWFPTYLAVLKVAAFAYVPLWLAVYVVVKRVQNPGSDWGSTLLATWGMAWTVAFFAAAVITFVFALVQFVDTRTHFMQEWQVSELPPVRDTRKISLAASISEILVNVTFMLWWLEYMSPLVILRGPSWKLSLLPAWNYYFWACLLIALFNTGLAFANLRWPYWSSFRAGCRMVSDLAGGVMFCWLTKTAIVQSFSIASLDAEHMAALRSVLHLVKERSFPFAVIAVAIVFAVDVYRIVRVSRGGERELLSKAVA